MRQGNILNEATAVSLATFLGEAIRGGFVIDKALYEFILLAYRGREGGQVAPFLSRGTSEIAAINQS